MNERRVARWGPPSLLVLLLAFGAFAFFYRVGDVPSASGDEGNWMALGHRFVHGLPVRLGQDSRFVTTAFARMISLSFRIGGVTIGAARATLGVCVLLGVTLIYALSARIGARALGLSIGALLVTHPWTVWWSRSVVAPYPIPLVSSLLGAMLWVVAIAQYRKRATDKRLLWKRHFALLVAGQLLVFALHFSPFGLLALLSCALWALIASDGRKALRTLGPWLSFAAVCLHALPIFLDVVTVVGQAHAGTRLNEWSARWRNLVRSMIDGLSGEQTLRDYVGDNARMPLGVTPSRVVVVALVLAAIGVALRRAKQQDETASHEARSLRAFAPLYFVVSALCLPLVLAPARDWWLATIDSERYFFAIISPAALLVATLTLSARRAGPALVALLAAYFVLGPDLRSARYFWREGGADHGYFSAHRGGGYRGYKVLAGPRSATTAIYEACRDASRGEPMTIAFNDYAFHPVRVLIRVKPDHHLNSVYIRDAMLPRGRRLCVPVWPEAMFEPGHIPGFAVENNRWMRNYVLHRMDESQRIAAWSQPNGAPLLEVYVGRVRADEAERRPQ